MLFLSHYLSTWGDDTTLEVNMVYFKVLRHQSSLCTFMINDK